MPNRLVLISATAWFLGASWVCAHAADLVVERLETRRYALPVDGPTRVHLPYFDAHGALRFEDGPVSLPSESVCAKISHVRAVLARPRVDHWQCAGAEGKDYLTGQTAEGERWTRALEFPSGTYRIKMYVLGASGDGLVLSDLEVWSPVDGETLRPAPVRQPIRERPVPRYSFVYAGAYRAAQDDFFVYQGESKQLDDKGGLYRLAPASGDHERLAGTQRHFLAPVLVDDIQLDATGRYLLLAEDAQFRGASWVRFAVFDLVRRKRVFEERHGKGLFQGPRIVAGPDGHLAFSYYDGGQRETVVVHYRLRSAHGTTP